MGVLDPTFLFGLVEFLAILSVAVAGVARWRRRRSRLDRLASTVSSAAALSVYPPSLRGGGPEVPPRPDEERRPAR